MAEVKVPFYGHVRQYHNLKNEIDGAISRVLESGVYTTGVECKKLEAELQAYTGVKHAITLNSDTDALWFAMLALGIGKGDEVITTSNTFWATAESIWLIGATPVFVDIDPATRNIDLTKIEEKITSKTKAIIPVHLYGLPVDMKVIKKIADQYNLFVIEDSAQALGSKGDTFKLGEYSDALCTSFITAKNLGCFGDGGAVFTNRDDIVEKMLRYRNHGSIKRSVHSVGWNSRLDEVQAAVLSEKLKHLDEWSDLRAARAAEYTEQLKDTGIQLPYITPGFKHVFHLYVIETDDRDGLQAYLLEKGVIALTNYPIAIHQQEGFPFGAGDPNPYLPLTERHASRVLSLPTYPELTSEEVTYVCDCVKEWVALQK